MVALVVCLQSGVLNMSTVLLKGLSLVTTVAALVVWDVTTYAQEYVLAGCFLMQSVAPLLVVHRDKQLSTLHLVIIPCSFNKAAGLCTIALCFMLLVDLCILCICCVVVLLQPAIKVYNSTRGFFRERHFIVMFFAYPVVTVTVRAILLASTCCYYVQVGIALFGFNITYNVIESRSPLEHSVLVQPFGTYAHDLNRGLAKVERFRKYCFIH